MNLLTAAHKTLQLPSLVKVTNIENNRSLILRVNDRGPFVKNRIIDVSKKAASILGFQKKVRPMLLLNIMVRLKFMIKMEKLLNKNLQKILKMMRDFIL